MFFAGLSVVSVLDDTILLVPLHCWLQKVGMGGTQP